MASPIKNIIFDLGGVLVDWSPKYVYSTIFKTDEEVDWFLNNICTMDWNEQQDAGRTLQAATDLLLDRHPEHEVAIKAYYGRWEEMLGGPIQKTVEILKTLVDSKKYKIVALTNWSAETFPVALERYEFLQWFDGIVVSGVEKCKKPEPELYNILLERYDLKPEESIFIDDNIKNIVAGNNLGIKSLHFQGPEKLLSELQALALL